MTIWWLALILAAIGSSGIAFIWLAVHLGRSGGGRGKPLTDSLEDAAKHFEKIIGENAMFLQQDLRLTTSQLNEYMKTEITRKLKEEFDKYEQSIMDAKQLAIESIQKTNAAIDEQRQVMGAQVQQEIAAEKKQIMERFERNMADIVNHYVLAAIGNQIDLNDQLEYILADLEANRAAILEDIQSGA